MEGTLSPQADPEHKVFQSGTFTGNPVSMAGGLAALNELEKKDYAYIDNMGEKIRTGLRKIAAGHKIPMQITGIASFFMPHVNSQPVRNNRDKLNGDLARQREFCMGLIVNGVYLPPAHQGALCFAHTAADIEKTLNVTEKVLKEMEK